MVQLQNIIVGIDHAARFCDISVATLRRHLEAGRVPFHRNGGSSYLFETAKLEEFKQQQKAYFWGRPGPAKKSEAGQ
jgi:excisionase family DNA binding protein